MNMQIVLSRPQIIIVRSRLSLSGKFRFRAVSRWPIIKVRCLNQFRKYWPSYLKWASSLLIKEFWSIRVTLSLLSVWIFFIVNRKIKNSKRGERNPQLLVKLHSEVIILNILSQRKKTNLRCMCAKARWQWNIFMLCDVSDTVASSFSKSSVFICPPGVHSTQANQCFQNFPFWKAF